MKTKFAN
jgi:hypothetical protein